MIFKPLPPDDHEQVKDEIQKLQVEKNALLESEQKARVLLAKVQEHVDDIYQERTELSYKMDSLSAKLMREQSPEEINYLATHAFNKGLLPLAKMLHGEILYVLVFKPDDLINHAADFGFASCYTDKGRYYVRDGYAWRVLKETA